MRHRKRKKGTPHLLSLSINGTFPLARASMLSYSIYINSIVALLLYRDMSEREQLSFDLI